MWFVMSFLCLWCPYLPFGKNQLLKRYSTNKKSFLRLYWQVVLSGPLRVQTNIILGTTLFYRDRGGVWLNLLFVACEYLRLRISRWFITESSCRIMNDMTNSFWNSGTLDVQSSSTIFNQFWPIDSYSYKTCFSSWFKIVTYVILVDGLEHQFYFSIYWECHHPKWRTHIVQRGRYTTNQIN